MPAASAAAAAAMRSRRTRHRRKQPRRARSSNNVERGTVTGTVTVKVTVKVTRGDGSRKRCTRRPARWQALRTGTRAPGLTRYHSTRKVHESALNHPNLTRNHDDLPRNHPRLTRQPAGEGVRGSEHAGRPHALKPRP
eukprot:48883-Rhodomonas_salina.1